MKKDKIITTLLNSPDKSNSTVAAETATTERYVRMIRRQMWQDARAKIVKPSSKEVVGIMADIHVPYHDETAVKAAVEYLKERKITSLVLLGDVVDFYKVSYFKKDPTRMSFKEEVMIARQFLKYLRNTFGDIKITYVEGNHEARLYNYLLDKAPELYSMDSIDVPNLLSLSDIDVQYVDNVSRLVEGQEPFKIGKLVLLHGHEVKMGWSSVNLPRLMFQKAKTNVLFGHFHKQQDYITKDVFGKMLGAWSLGCLCHLSERYMPVNEWSQGVAVVTVDTATGKFNVDNRIIYKGEVL